MITDEVRNGMSPHHCPTLVGNPAYTDYSSQNQNMKNIISGKKYVRLTLTLQFFWTFSLKEK